MPSHAAYGSPPSGCGRTRLVLAGDVGQAPGRTGPICVPKSTDSLPSASWSPGMIPLPGVLRVKTTRLAVAPLVVLGTRMSKWTGWLGPKVTLVFCEP